MKQLFTLFLMALAIPMNGLAQNEHLFPEVTFTYNGETYTIPAWDAKGNLGERVQSTFETTTPQEETGDDGGLPSDNPLPGGGENPYSRSTKVPYKGILVATGCALNSSGLPVGGFTGAITVNGYEYADAAAVKYIDVFPSMEATLGNELLFSTDKITGDTYTVPIEVEPFAQDSKASKYDITEIGQGAYANKSCSTSDLDVYMQATKVTIPKGIVTMGKYAFYANALMTEIILKDNISEIKVFPEGAFYDCVRLRSAYFPGTLERVESHAFGGCKVLRLLFLYPENSPEIANDAFLKYEGSTSTDLKTEDCVGWVPNGTEMSAAHDKIRRYRKGDYGSIWEKFPFRMPITFPESGITSFYSDQYICFHEPNIITSGDGANSWKVREDIAIGYVPNKDATGGQNPTATEGGYKLRMYWMNTKAQSPLAVRNQGLLIKKTGNAASLWFPACTDAGISVKPQNSTAITRKYNFQEYQDYDLLKGTVAEEGVNMTTLLENTANFYLLLKGGKFVLSGEGTLPKYKAYMELPKTYFQGRLEAKDFEITFGDEEGDTDGIEGIENSKKTIENDVVYDLQGRVVSTKGMGNLQKGIYVMNGKKFILK
jgi:hypothetical protein